MLPVEAPLPHLVPGVRPGRPVHLVTVRRSGSEYAPLRWRAYCGGCQSWRIAPDGTADSWRRLMSEVMFHLLTGMWS